ncbi:MAG: iron ABC transporter permease [Neomegalonema sp.]|nr:iron ABC transporter permease [Neomegalonema sp.]
MSSSINNSFHGDGDHRRQRDRYALTIALLAALVLVMFVLSLLIGTSALSMGDSLAAIWGGRGEAAWLVMSEIRLPRSILGAAIGASLGLSGAALQGFLRNPLAEPGLIGVTSAASLGAVLAIYTGFASLFALALPIGALLGAGAATLLVQVIAGGAGSMLSLILAGVAITSFAGAMTSLVLNMSSNPFAALEIVFWMMGSLADRSMLHVQIALPFMVLGWVLLGLLGRGLDALTLGDEAAASLGIRLDRLRLMAILGTAASVGAATAVAGGISFVGLVVPHLLRPLVGAQPSRLLLASALGGAALLLGADIATRLLVPQQELKLGVLTALVGAPFFLWLVIRTRRQLT